MNKIGDIIKLLKQNVKVEKCEKCNTLMVNIDQKELAKGDIDILKEAGVRISNPSTKDPICLKCEIKREEEEYTFKRKINSYMDEDDSSNDSHFFGGGSFGGFGGGFGGFGGGSFSGGGASGSF